MRRPGLSEDRDRAPVFVYMLELRGKGLPVHCQVQERAANRLYNLSAKIVQSVSGSLLYLTKQESA